MSGDVGLAKLVLVIIVLWKSCVGVNNNNNNNWPICVNLTLYNIGHIYCAGVTSSEYFREHITHEHEKQEIVCRECTLKSITQNAFPGKNCNFVCVKISVIQF